jgi:hypothetical protein
VYRTGCHLSNSFFAFQRRGDDVMISLDFPMPRR